MALGTAEEQQSEIASALQSESVAIDLIALLTLHHLKLLPLLPKMFKHTFVHSSLLDAVVADLRNIQQHPETGGVSYVDGKYFRHERTAEQDQIAITWLSELRDFLKSPAVELTGLLPESLTGGNAKLIGEVCGLACAAPMFVAREKSVPLFSDDACVRSLGRTECKVTGFSIQAFLRVATHKNLITATEYQDAVIKLIKANYAFISEDSGVLRRCYENDKGRMSQLASFLINRVNDAQYNARSCLGLLSEFAIFLWRNHETGEANSREEWLKEMWLAFSKSPNAETLIYEFVAYLAINCGTQPAVFFGILNNAMLEIPFVNRRRRDFFQDIAIAANTMIRLSQETFPFWPTLAKEWLEHKTLNDRLAKLGFFDSHNFDLPRPVKNPAKHQNKKSRKVSLTAKRRARKKHF